MGKRSFKSFLDGRGQLRPRGGCPNFHFLMSLLEIESVNQHKSENKPQLFGGKRCGKTIKREKKSASCDMLEESDFIRR